MQSGQRSDIVFSMNGDYTGYHRVRNEWKRALKRAGMPRNKMHWLRHSVAYLLIADGVDVKSVQQQRGPHSAQFTLDVYIANVSRLMQ
jgi:integrase